MILRKIWGGNTLIPLYDNEDAVCGIIYNNAAYYFQKNLQGDIIALTNHYGAVQVRYTYDAWGVPTVSYDITPAQIGNINPFRYRGYYYDTELGMYYIQSRYYDPTVGRFINADDVGCINMVDKTNNTSLFNYCENDPTNKTDETGFATTKVVAYGLQIELNVGWRIYGVELVWYTVSSIRKGRTWYIPYVYLYGGGGLSSDLTGLISKITKNPALLFNPKKLTKASASVSVFAIFGYTGKFTKPQSYEGWFTGVSATVSNVKAYTSWCSKCFVVGIGVSTSKFSASSGATYYVLSSKLYKSMSNVYNSVSKKAKTIKKK